MPAETDLGIIADRYGADHFGAQMRVRAAVIS
jgi:hypothetical protein